MKNIIIFSDGTGQDGGTENNTNVYKLFNIILDRSDKQISFYDPGVGMGFKNLQATSEGAVLDRMSGSVTGLFYKNINTGTKYISLGSAGEPQPFVVSRDSFTISVYCPDPE